MERNKIYCGDALEVLKTFPDECIDCCITSPPYYNLRDYGVKGQIGLEKTYNKYLDNLIRIYVEVKRVLKPTGTIWVNIGDTYGGSNGNGYKQTIEKENTFKGKYNNMILKTTTKNYSKSLLNIPSRFAIRMTDELGLILRNEIIWYKRNAMPNSVKDRFTVDFEKIYFFVKNKKYYFNQLFEDKQLSSLERVKYPRTKNKNTKMVKNIYSIRNNDFTEKEKLSTKRNKRCVWNITAKPNKENHFATFPEDLVRPMIEAGCPKEICNNCGKVVSTVIIKNRVGSSVKRGAHDIGGNVYNIPRESSKILEIKTESCNCNSGFNRGVVLDIFAGSGTTLKVTKDMERDYIGIELNPEYIKIIEKRLELDKIKLAI